MLIPRTLPLHNVGYAMRLTERKLGGWSLLLGTAAVAVGYALSPGRGAVDTVPIVILWGGILMLHGLLTL